MKNKMMVSQKNNLWKPLQKLMIKKKLMNHKMNYQTKKKTPRKMKKI